MTCPVGGPEIPDELEDELTTAAMVGGTYNVGDSDDAPSSYLFTWYFKKGSKGSRVIAGDAAAGSAADGAAYSTNHGDSSSDKSSGANALFGDGHVESTKTAGGSYTLDGYNVKSGTTTSKNPWGTDVSPSATNVDYNLSLIGFYGTPAAAP